MKYVDLQKQQHMRKEESRGLGKLMPILAVIGAIALVLIIFRDSIKEAFNPISIVANVAATNIKETDGRTNILIMGSDRRDVGAETGRSVLTDTLLVASIGRVDKDVVLISLPRDLWVKTSDGQHSKINAIYALGELSQNGKGAEDIKKVTEDVLGLPIHYHVLVTFQLFEEAIDILGGVNVVVDNTFVDYEYPVEGKENETCGRTQEEIDKMIDEYALHVIFPCRYETVEFKAGQQTMDGKTALKYVRSRKGNNDEGTDFARSKRQQKVITAIKEKVLSLQTLIDPTKLKELYDTYSKNVDTNIDFSTVQGFYMLSQQIDFSRIVSVVLDDRSAAEDGGLLYAPVDKTLYGGQYVLVPQTGDYSQIHAYVQKYLFQK